MNAPINQMAGIFPVSPGLMAAPGYIELQATGFEQGTTDIQRDILSLSRKFAADVMRPNGAILDRMTPDQVIGEGSLYWATLQGYQALGFNLETFAAIPPEEASDVKAMIYEELGWGDSGLAISIGAGGLAHTMAARWGRLDLLEAFPGTMLGCWGITEPVAGSDMLDWTREAGHPQADYGRPSLIATLKGDQVILNGQKAAWVSNGTTAQFCTLFTTFDRGQGREGVNIYVPLDLPGVSRGKPLEKMGQRALPQGEIFFDNVAVPARFIAAGPDQYADAVYDILCEANAGMGACFVGVARAAYEHALAYAHERKQGGVPIIRHQNVRYRLFHMLRKVEAARALARRVFRFNDLSGVRALQASIASKITGTQTAFEVANEALQMFGGNGMTCAYPLEKLLRDARASLIEDGCNEMLAIKGGSLLADTSKL
ncbi:MAG: acyl-CoA dehydrogenase [Xanthobacteraceae bacterium]|nr:acyl-CoA dehydrogenase [Xanthobacteraceae bacterium]